MRSNPDTKNARSTVAQPDCLPTIQYLKKAVIPLKARYTELCQLSGNMHPSDHFERKQLHNALKVIVPFLRALIAYSQVDKSTLSVQCQYAAQYARLRSSLALQMDSPLFYFFDSGLLALQVPHPGKPPKNRTGVQHWPTLGNLASAPDHIVNSKKNRLKQLPVFKQGNVVECKLLRVKSLLTKAQWRSVHALQTAQTVIAENE